MLRTNQEHGVFSNALGSVIPPQAVIQSFIHWSITRTGEQSRETWINTGGTESVRYVTNTAQTHPTIVHRPCFLLIKRALHFIRSTWVQADL